MASCWKLKPLWPVMINDLVHTSRRSVNSRTSSEPFSDRLLLFSHELNNAQWYVGTITNEPKFVSTLEFSLADSRFEAFDTLTKNDRFTETLVLLQLQMEHPYHMPTICKTLFWSSWKIVHIFWLLSPIQLEEFLTCFKPHHGHAFPAWKIGRKTIIGKNNGKSFFIILAKGKNLMARNNRPTHLLERGKKSDYTPTWYLLLHAQLFDKVAVFFWWEIFFHFSDCIWGWILYTGIKRPGKLAIKGRKRQ